MIGRAVESEPVQMVVELGMVAQRIAAGLAEMAVQMIAVAESGLVDSETIHPVRMVVDSDQMEEGFQIAVGLAEQAVQTILLDLVSFQIEAVLVEAVQTSPPV